MKCKYCGAFDSVLPNRTDDIETCCPRDRSLDWRIRQGGVQGFVATSVDEAMRFLRGTGAEHVSVHSAGEPFPFRSVYAPLERRG